MKIVTSFSPSRSQRQNRCLASWLTMGCEVVGVQSCGEAEQMSSLYPGASFVETDLVGDLFGRPKLVRVKALLNQAVDSPILIINSDIEITTKPAVFNGFWGTVGDNELKMGVRWDVHPRLRRVRLFKWGIDAFLITPKIAESLEDIGMTMGCPAWDYWIPWCLHQLGYRITTNKEVGLMHELHDKGWSGHEYECGLKLFSDHYGVTGPSLTNFVQQITDRTKTQNWRPRL